MIRRDFIKIPAAAAVAGTLTLAARPSMAQQPVTILNVSYDPTRELYAELNASFARHWKATTGQEVVVLDTGARGSSISFAQRNQGDVFISWENEAFLLAKEFGGKFMVVYPSLSILAEPPVAVVDRNVNRKGTRAVAEAYLKYLYTEEGQDIAGRNFCRPAISQKAQARHAGRFPKLGLFTIEQAFGGWAQANKDHFADGGSFDQIYTRK